MAQGGSNKKAGNLVSASCAAVLAVYAAGYVRTQSAANRFAAQVAERRVAAVGWPQPASPRVELRPAAPDASEIAPSSAAPISPNPDRDALFKPNLTASAETAPTNAAEAPPAETFAPAPVIPEAPPAVSQPAEPTAPAVERKVETAPAVPAAPLWKDGTYTGWGYSRHGNIEASVVIEGGRIASASISECRTRYSCSVIDRLPPQVAQRQSADVDYVSGATQSADAFYGAVVAALSKAK